jgi:hypothetical protein
MNKYLLMSATAVIAGTTTAGAGTYCFNFENANGGSCCDSGMIVTGVDGGAFSGALRAWIHANNNCAGGTSEGYGILGKTNGPGKVSFMSDDIYAKNYNDYTTAAGWTLPRKIKNGQPWSVWVGFSGATLFEAGSGWLVGVSKCKNHPLSHGTKSTVELVRTLVAAHRNTQKS